MAIKGRRSIRPSPGYPSRVYGVDFSGAKDAGKKIWIASGVIEDGVLRIEDCRRGDALTGSGKGRDRCLTALRDFIERQEGACAFGIDFPFGLPRALVKQDNWEDFVLSFPGSYSNPEEFRYICRVAAGGSELKRVTDRESRTPFSSYNLRLYRQTYFGIRDVLHPLVRDRLAYVLPMQSALPDRPWVLEICPASTLKRENLYLRYYKRGTDESYATRARILEGIEATGILSIPAREVRSAVLEDRHGDALDSVIAAFATFRAIRNPVCLTVEDNEAYTLEGYVYV